MLLDDVSSRRLGADTILDLLERDLARNPCLWELYAHILASLVRRDGIDCLRRRGKDGQVDRLFRALRDGERRIGTGSDQVRRDLIFLEERLGGPGE
jgi:hypothetical protein